MESLNKIALTGSTGSIGLEFPKKCSKLYTRLEASTYKMISEINKLKVKPETLIHLSALVSTKKCKLNPKKAYELNILGATKWYKASKYTGIKNFIFISTSHVYKSIKNKNVVINYGFDTEPGNVYGKSKLIAEKKLKYGCLRCCVRSFLGRWQPLYLHWQARQESRAVQRPIP